jgi:hypothetical protein
MHNLIIQHLQHCNVRSRGMTCRSKSNLVLNPSHSFFPNHTKTQFVVTYMSSVTFSFHMSCDHHRTKGANIVDATLFFTLAFLTFIGQVVPKLFMNRFSQTMLTWLFPQQYFVFLLIQFKSAFILPPQLYLLFQ